MRFFKRPLKSVPRFHPPQAWGPGLEILEARQLLTSAAFDLIGLTAMRADPAFRDIDGTGMTVAVIDTGVDITHPLLRSAIRDGADLVFGGTNPRPVDEHGTHVAGIIAARNRDIGVAMDAGIVGLQVFTPIPGREPGATDLHIQSALRWVLDNRVEHNIVAVNMSLGGGFFTSASQVNAIYIDEIESLERAGVTVVSAAGNSYGVEIGSNGQLINHMFPNAGSPGINSTLAVGAVWETNEGSRQIGLTFEESTGADRIAGFSQRPPLNEGNVLFAPGALINSTMPGNRQAQLAGTSMASPMVAGAVALVQEAALKFAGRLLTPLEVRNLLISTGDPIFDGDNEDSLAFADENGDGRIVDDELIQFQYTQLTYRRLNVHNAVRAIRDNVLIDAPPPPGGGAGSGDPNGTIAGAYIGPVLDGSPVTGVLGTIGVDGGATQVGPTDVDIIRFQTISPGRLTLQLVSNPSSRRDFDSLLRLFDDQGMELAFDDDGQGVEGGFSRLEIDLAPGVYHAGVSGFNNRNYDPNDAGSGVTAATGNYLLNFALTNIDPNGLISGAVHADFGPPQDPVVFDGNIGFDYGSPVGASDVDLFRLTVNSPGTIYLDIDTPYADEFVDSFLRLFDSQGMELGRSDDDLDTLTLAEVTDAMHPGLVFEDPVSRELFHGHTLDSFLAFDVPAGVYYLGVSDYFNDAYNPANLTNRSTGGDGGFYQLKISFANNDVNGSIYQARDLDGAALPYSSPGVIGTDDSSGGTEQVGDRDVDFIRIQAPAAGILEIDIDSHSLMGNADPVDTVLYLYDEQGNVLAGNDDEDGYDPLLRISVMQGQTFLVAVAGYGNDSFDPFLLGSGMPGDTGEYILNVRLLAADLLNQLIDDRISSGGLSNITEEQTIAGFLGEDDGLIRPAGDVDLYRFIAPRNANIRFRADGSNAFDADTFLRLFDATGRELASNNNAAPTDVSAELRFDVRRGQTYFLGVSGNSANPRAYNPFTGAGLMIGSTGAYTLTASPTHGNRGPTLTSVTPLRDGVESRPLMITYSQLLAAANEMDADGDPISFILSAPTLGTLTLDGQPVQAGDLLAEGQQVIWTPPVDSRGLLSAFTIRASDGAAQSATAVPVRINTVHRPSITITASDPLAAEGNLPSNNPRNPGRFTITRSGGAIGQPLTVHYTITGSAANGDDYTMISDMITIPAGRASEVIHIHPVDDALIEGPDTVTISLDADDSYRLGLPARTSATVRINDNDKPTLSFGGGNGSVNESGLDDGLVRIQRDGMTTHPLTVHFLVAGVAQRGPRGDYLILVDGQTLIGNTVVIPAGEDHVDVVIRGVENALAEPNESFRFSLRTNPEYLLSDNTLFEFALSDNEPVVAIEALDALGSETGPDPAVFRIFTYAGLTQPLVVNFRITGTARSGVDFINPGLSITIPVNATSVELPIEPFADALAEAAENVRISLSTSTAYSIDPPLAWAEVMIANGAAPAQADLLIASANFTARSISIAGPEAPFNATVTLRNQGLAATPATMLRAVLSRDRTLDGADLHVGTIDLPILPAISTLTMVIRIDPDDVIAAAGDIGDYFVILLADSGLLVAEANETNNFWVSGKALVTIRA